jgi:serine phosphatase RsbU (regulator of sigma subunit)
MNKRVRHIAAGAPHTGNATRNSFATLSNTLNNCPDENMLLKEAMDGVLRFSSASAGLLRLFQPVDLLYAKSHTCSPAIDRLENLLRNNGNVLQSLLEPGGARRVDGAVVFPLQWQKQIIGVLAVDERTAMLSSHSTTLLSALCNQLAAILGGRPPAQQLGGPVREQDLRFSRELQENLQPEIPAQVCGLEIAAYSQPAEYVGGDYYDLITVGSGELGIVIADVQGKGFAGALYGNLLRSTFHFLTRESNSTSEVITRLQSILKQQLTVSPLFTMFYGVYDERTRVLRYTGAGHVQPVVIRSDDSMERLGSQSAPIGADSMTTLGERSVRLAAGDVAVFFTDGLMERPFSDGGAGSEADLIRAIRSHRKRPVREIQTQVLSAMLGGATPSDDVTLLVARVAR